MLTIAVAPGPGESNDRLVDASPLDLGAGGGAILQGVIGDGYFGWADVDLYRLDLAER